MPQALRHDAKSESLEYYVVTYYLLVINILK